MNHIYRTVWNAITHTVVAVAETAKARGRGRSGGKSGSRGGSRAAAEFADAGAFGLLAALEAVARTPAPRDRALVTPRPLVLEQRFMFDGAALAEAVDTTARSFDVARAAAGPVAHDRSADAAALRLELVTPGGLPTRDAVRDGQALAERVVAEFLSRQDARERMFELFAGGRSEPDAAWHTAFDRLTADLRSGYHTIRV